MVYHLVWKNSEDQERSGRSKTVDSEAVFQAIEVKQVRSTQRLSGELIIFTISKFMELAHLVDVSLGFF